MPVSNLGRIGFVTKGDWSAGTYKYLDVVGYASATWICAVPTTDEEPGAGTDWQNALTAPEVTGIADWSQLSGTQSPPLIVYDDQKYWALITTVSNIAANKPSESPDVFRSEGIIDDTVTSSLTTWSSEKITSLSLINAPQITSPANETIGFIGEITSTYTTSSSYAGSQDWVRWEASTLEDFSTLVDSYEGGSNLTSWTPGIGMALTQIFIRTKQGSDGHRSEWSTVISFTTPDIYVEAPTLTVEGSPDDVPETPTLETSEFSVFNGSDTHLNTDWQIRDDQLQVVWESLADSANKLSIVVPAGILLESTTYTFRARHRGVAYGVSAWVSVVATTKAEFFVFDPSSAGQPFGGGYYAGANIIIDEQEYALIVAPRSQGGLSSEPLQWKTANTETPDTGSRNDGWTNSNNMNNTSHPATHFCRGLNINGYDDWYFPSWDELEICYRYLKPTTESNATSGASGENPSSNPLGSGYTANNPSQTSISIFQGGGGEDFRIDSGESYYWASTQGLSTGQARAQRFSTGFQTESNSGKTQSFWVRAVRRVAL